MDTKTEEPEREYINLLSAEDLKKLDGLVFYETDITISTDKLPTDVVEWPFRVVDGMQIVEAKVTLNGRNIFERCSFIASGRRIGLTTGTLYMYVKTINIGKYQSKKCVVKVSAKCVLMS